MTTTPHARVQTPTPVYDLTHADLGAWVRVTGGVVMGRPDGRLEGWLWAVQDYLDDDGIVCRSLSVTDADGVSVDAIYGGDDDEAAAVELSTSTSCGCGWPLVRQAIPLAAAVGSWWVHVAGPGMGRVCHDGSLAEPAHTR